MATLLLYSATMSLDGYIAGPGGDMSWLTEHLAALSPKGDQVLPQIGAILAGHRTFRGDDPNAGTEHEGAYGGQYDGPVFVLTHRPLVAPVEGVTFVDDLGAAVEQARAAAGERYVNVLGADVARQCLRAGLLDEVLVLVAPVLLGDGVPLFHDPGGTRVRLERVRDDFEHWYRVMR